MFLRLYLVLTVLLPTKYPKIVTGPLNECGIVWIWLCPLECILKFATKLLAKLCLGNFKMFLKFYSLFKIFAPQKPPKNYHRSLNEVCHKSNLLFLFIIYVKVFHKFVFFTQHIVNWEVCFVFWSFATSRIPGWILNCSTCAIDKVDMSNIPTVNPLF